ncbi:MAG: hypothetical protein R2854_10460 [Caldilineaceae bacterium]
MLDGPDLVFMTGRDGEGDNIRQFPWPSPWTTNSSLFLRLSRGEAT